MVTLFALAHETESSPARNGWAASLRQALFPRLCLACKAELKNTERYVCAPCAASLSSTWHTLCPVCEKNRAFSALTRCAHAPSSLSTVSHLFLFEQPAVRALIHSLKYAYIPDALRPFVPFLERERLNMLRIPADVIVPIPLHPRRERERGFNQSTLLATEVAAVIKVPVRPLYLRRVRAVRPQATSRTRHSRLRNVRGIFCAQHKTEFTGSTVLLVDDVMTTGATLTQAARVLERAGARHVHGLVLARET